MLELPDACMIAAMDEPTISIVFLRHIANCVDLTSKHSSVLLEEFGLTRDMLDERDRMIRLQDFLDFFERAAVHVGNPHFGLQAGRLAGADSLGPLSFMFLSAPTLQQAFASFVRYLDTMQQSVRNAFIVEGGRAIFEYAVQGETLLNRRQDAEYSIGATYSLAKTYSGGRLELIEVCFEHDRIGEYSRYRDFFGCDVFFGQDRNSLAFDAKLLDSPGQILSSELFPILVDHMEGKAETNADDMRLVDRVRDLLNSLPVQTVPTMNDVSVSLGVPAQTINRRLKGDNLSWRNMVRERRLNAAARLLRESDRSVAEIALAVGFAESASFIRSFQAVFGETPAQYRRNLRTT